MFSVLLIYTAMNINTLKPAYDGTASDGIFPVGNMFLLVQVHEFRLLGARFSAKAKFWLNLLAPELFFFNFSTPCI